MTTLYLVDNSVFQRLSHQPQVADALRAFATRPPSFTGVDDMPSVISVQMGRGAPEQAECDVSMTAIWLGQVHLFRARYFMGRWPGTRR